MGDIEIWQKQDPKSDARRERQRNRSVASLDTTTSTTKTLFVGCAYESIWQIRINMTKQISKARILYA